MSETEYSIDENIYLKRGEIIIAYYEYEIDYFIPGEYELKLSTVNEISKIVKLNDKLYTRIKIPKQDEIINILSKTLEIIEKEKWFTHIDKSQQQFSRFEGVIAKSLTKFKLNENTKIGLIGELYVLNSILNLVSKKEYYDEIINGWFGFISKSRDFIFGGKCIEVKSTTNEKSIHHISNLNQVDHVDDDGGTTDLFMASIGLSKQDEGISIPSLVESIISNLDDENLQTQVLENISKYGSYGIGYNHNRMINWSQFQTKYQILFERYYDMSDPNIKLLRFSDLVGMTSLIEKSITYKIELESVIEGSENNPFSLQELVLLIFN